MPRLKRRIIDGAEVEEGQSETDHRCFGGMSIIEVPGFVNQSDHGREILHVGGHRIIEVFGTRKEDGVIGDEGG